ncbi:MAG: hypothetical protein OXT72_03235 [Gammaproteobacteria bacterium]|nr:hypothetical protein [Gammaproteobacteria bacterium]MDE0249272.1 hypothetical protein [Gammaproteobacteria bacterium]
MTWSEVFRWLALIAGAAASLAALLWTLGRIFRPWMREAAREAADDVRAEVKALADKLATNDFPHIETKIENVEAKACADRVAMETRLGERMERMEARLGERTERMEARLRERTEHMEARLRERTERMEARIMNRAREDRAAILAALAGDGATKTVEVTDSSHGGA